MYIILNPYQYHKTHYRNGMVIPYIYTHIYIYICDYLCIYIYIMSIYAYPLLKIPLFNGQNRPPKKPGHRIKALRRQHVHRVRVFCSFDAEIQELGPGPWRFRARAARKTWKK